MRKKLDTTSNKRKEDLKFAILIDDFLAYELLIRRRLA